MNEWCARKDLRLKKRDQRSEAIKKTPPPFRNVPKTPFATLLFMLLALTILESSGIDAGNHAAPAVVAGTEEEWQGHIEANEARIAPLLRHLKLAISFYMGNWSRYPDRLWQLEGFLRPSLGVLCGEAHGYYFGLLTHVKMRSAPSIYPYNAPILAAVPVQEGMSGVRAFMLPLGDRTVYQANINSAKRNAATEWVPGADGVPLEYGEVVMYGRFPFDADITDTWKPVDTGKGLCGAGVFELIRKADWTNHPGRAYHAAMSEIKRRGEVGIRQVLEIARDGEDVRDRAAAVRVLARLEVEPDGSVVETLEQILEAHPSGRLRLWSAYALARLTGRYNHYVDALMAPYRDGERLDRHALVAIASLGPKGADAAPFLIEEAERYLSIYQEEGREATMTRGCLWALGRIGAGAADALPLLIRIAEGDPKSELMPETCESLGRIGADPERIVPLLISVLRRGDTPARYYAAKGLGHLGREAQRALPALFDAMEEPELRVIAGTVRALIQRASEEGR